MAKDKDIKLNTASLASFSPEEMLSYLQENGKIDLGDVSNEMQNTRRKQLLAKHNYKIYRGKDGRWRTYIKDDSLSSGRKLLVKTSKWELEDAVCDYYLSKEEEYVNSSINMEELYPEWIEYKRLRVSPRTVDSYGYAWDKYYKGEEITKMPIRNIDKLTLDDWIHKKIHDYDMTAHSYTNFRVVVNQMLQYAVDRGIIDHSVSDDVRVDRRRVLKPEVKKPDRTQVYSPEEQKKLFKVAWDYFNNDKHLVQKLVPLAVMFMFLTGLRVGEVSAIRYEDVRGNRLNVSRFFRTKCNEIVDHTKGNFGARNVILVPQAIELIETAKKYQNDHNMPSDGYIFSINDLPAKYEAIQKAFVKYCKAAKIPVKSSHKARKTYISTLIDSQVNINTICQQVGHKDPRTTYRSYCYDRSSSDEIYDAICDALG